MASEAPKVTVVDFNEVAPDVLEPDEKHVARLESRVPSEEAHRAISRAAYILKTYKAVKDLTIWVNPEHTIRARSIEIAVKS